MRGPYGDTVAAAPYAYGGDVNVNVNSGAYWGGYYGPGYGAAAVAGAAAGLAVGTAVATLPDYAAPVVVDNKTYYIVGNTYYRSCYQGTEVSYCVVPDPNQ